MNFLAHLWLAERTGTSLAGAILGDVVRGADLSAYPPELALGIRLHRRIDARTDRHPQIRALRSGFAAGARRYAGIVIDLACDHALAADWSSHSAEPLAVFCQRAAVAVARQARWFEYAGGCAPDAERFAALLRSYAEPSGIDQAFARIARRLRAPAPLLAAASDWPRHARALQAGLPTLLAELVADVADLTSSDERSADTLCYRR
ncbi:Acyl carrier protein phosphodiesterase [Fontimonas thermophila]|uniref:Acyl carrier protein phosphodiesterase n=1 Tax=Fontimonas thermophila TaxID=1076937 RepID=A0A1I2HC27_9GAMM|nr:ACP phosphodiesterase [Fontimonas thermophila]SFF27089.1 Acyl carrier protein phosphodiesterase [Fontimonas thermophila]